MINVKKQQLFGIAVCLLLALAVSQSCFAYLDDTEFLTEFPLFTVKVSKLLDQDCGYTDKDLANWPLTFNDLGVCNDDRTGAPWIKANGGLPDQVNTLYLYNGYLYAGTDEGVYKIDDAGANWVKVSNILLNTRVLVLYSHNGYLYAGTEDGIVKINTGEKLLSPVKGENKIVLHLYSYNSYLYIVTAEGLFKTNDDGKNWIQVDNGLEGATVITLCSHGGCLYAGTEQGVFKTNDGGANWASVSKAITVGALHSHGAGLYAIAEGRNYNTAVFCTHDEGINWTKTDIIDRSEKIRALYRDNHYLLYAITRDGEIFKSNNGGENWTVVNENTENSIEPYCRTTPYFYNGSLYVRTHQGVFKNNLVVGLPKFAQAAHSQEGYLYMGKHGKVFKANDGGTGWKKIGIGLSQQQEPQEVLTKAKVWSLNSHNGSLYASVGDKVFKTSNGGISWTKILDCKNVYTLYSYGNYLYAISLLDGILRIKDGEEIWKKANNGLPGSPWYNIEALHFHNGFLYAATGDGIFKTSNNGENWSAVNNGIKNLDIKTLYSYNGSLYAGTKAHGVFITNNDGISWSEANNGIDAPDIISFDAHDGYLYALTNRDVFKTNDGGKNWEQASNVILNKNVNELCLHEGYLYAGAYYGLFKTKAKVETPKGGLPKDEL